jgi:hypothetical protein
MQISHERSNFRFQMSTTVLCDLAHGVLFSAAQVDATVFFTVVFTLALRTDIQAITSAVKVFTGADRCCHALLTRQKSSSTHLENS